MDMSGAIFKNDKKESDQHPDFNGKATVNGVEYWVNAWVKTYVKDGAQRKYFSLSFKPKDAQPVRPAAPPAKPAGATVASGFDDMVDDIPF